MSPPRLHVQPWTINDQQTVAAGRQDQRSRGRLLTLESRSRQVTRGIIHAMNRPQLPNCLWISPAAVGAGHPETSSQRFAHSIAGRANLVVHELAVWHRPADEPYDLGTELAAIERDAAHHGMERYHLFGFSAGATVALAATLKHGGTVQTVTVFEPATIGDDDWSPVETRWRQELAAVRALPAEQRPAAFRRLVMGDDLSPFLPAPPVWTPRTDSLEAMLAAVGFVSADLARISQPTMVLTGGPGHVRFRRLAERMVEVMPHAKVVTFPGCNHLAPPHREDPMRLAEVLTRAWDTA
jgi:pimeloyl-ACP methyl ester carboxylesterase